MWISNIDFLTLPFQLQQPGSAGFSPGVSPQTSPTAGGILHPSKSPPLPGGILHPSKSPPLPSYVAPGSPAAVAAAALLQQHSTLIAGMYNLYSILFLEGVDQWSYILPIARYFSTRWNFSKLCIGKSCEKWTGSSKFKIKDSSCAKGKYSKNLQLLQVLFNNSLNIASF